MTVAGVKSERRPLGHKSATKPKQGQTHPDAIPPTLAIEGKAYESVTGQSVVEPLMPGAQLPEMLIWMRNDMIQAIEEN